MLFGRVDKNGKPKILNDEAAFLGWFLLFICEKNPEIAVNDGQEVAEVYHRRGRSGEYLREYLKRNLPDYYAEYAYGKTELCSAEELDRVWDDLCSVMTTTEDSLLIKKYKEGICIR